MSSPASKRLALITAIVAPLMLISASLWAINAFRTPPVNDTAANWDRHLTLEPSVVIFGNSVAKRDLKAGPLAEQLGVPRRKLLILTSPNSNGALWYAALKNRVYAHDHQPKLVIIVAELSAQLATTTATDDAHAALMRQLTDHEPVIAAKTFGSAWGGMRWQWLKQRRTDLRDHLLAQVRDFTVGALFTREVQVVGRVRGKNARRKRQNIGNGSLLQRGAATAQPAMDLVFSDENLDWSLHNRVIPVVEKGIEGFDKISLPAPGDSYLPDFISLAQDHGARVVIVRAPLAPGNGQDDLGPEIDRAAVSYLNQLGAGFIDLRTLDLRDRHFSDMLHMNRDGARIFTRAMARGLAAIGALSAGPMKPAIVPLSPATIIRTGTPTLPNLGQPKQLDHCLYELPINGVKAISDAALAAAGYPGTSPLILSVAGTALEPGPVTARCSGTVTVLSDRLRFAPPRSPPGVLTLGLRDNPVQGNTRAVSWVAPGSQLRLTFDSAWGGDDDSFVVHALAETFGPGSSVPRLRIDDGSWQPFQPKRLVPPDADASHEGYRGNPNRYELGIDPPAPSGPFSLEIDAGDRWLMVQGLTIGEGLATNLILGNLEDNRGTSARLIGGVATTFEGHHGRVSDPIVVPIYPDPPMAVRHHKLKRGPNNTGRFEWPRMAFVTDVITEKRTTFGKRCSPITVLEDGVPLPMAHASCPATQAKGRGRFCHERQDIYFTASDNSDPISNGRSYELALSPDRQCDRMYWLYPGDHFVLQPPAVTLARFRDGLAQIELDLTPFSSRYVPFDLDVALTINGKLRLDERVPSTAFKRGAMRWRLDPPAPPGTTDVQLEISNPSDVVYLMVTVAALSEYLDPDKEYVQPKRSLVGSLKLPTGPAVPVEISRQGQPPMLPPTTGLRKVKGSRGPCGYRIPYAAMAHLSDTYLKDIGVGRASPLRLLEDGAPLKAHSTIRQYRSMCAGAFGHTGKNLWFSPTGQVEAGLERTYTVALNPDLPTKRVDGEPVYWVYPGTQLHVRFPEGWPADRGALTTLVDVTLADDGGAGQASVALFGHAYPLSYGPQDPPRAEVLITPDVPPEGPFEIVLISPSDGPYLVVQNLWLGAGAQGAAVIHLPRSRPR